MFLANQTKWYEPISYKEVATDKNWRGAIQKELDALEQNKTWEVVSLPPAKYSNGI